MIGRSLKDRNENVVYSKNCAVHAEECWLRQRETAMRSSCGDDGMGSTLLTHTHSKSVISRSLQRVISDEEESELLEA